MAEDLGTIGDLSVGFKVNMAGLDSGVSDAKAKLESVGDAAKSSSEKASSGIGGMLKNALSFAAGQAIFTGVGDAIGFVKDQITDTIRVEEDHQAVMAQTIAGLRSTHDVSGMTAQAIGKLADSLSQVTPYSEETIQSAENLELTFTQIGKNVFPQATQAILDISAKMGGNLQGAAIQVGKALGNPIQGLTALTRIGVTFSDQQKKVITQMMDTGNVAGAQKVILQELEKEFGGAAQAAGGTLGGKLQILNNRLDEVKTKIGDDVTPMVTQFLGVIEQDGMPILNNFSDWFDRDAVPALKDLSGDIGPLAGDVEQFADSLYDTVEKSGALPSILGTIRDVLPDIETFAGNVGSVFSKELLPPTLSLVKNFSDWVDKSGLLKDGLHLLGDGVTTLSGFLSPLIEDLSNVFGWLSKNKPATDALEVAVITLGTAFVGLKITNTVTGFAQMFGKITEGKGVVEGLAGAFKGKLGGAFNEFLGDHAPNVKRALDDIGGKAKGAAGEIETMGDNSLAASGEVSALGTAAETAAGEETLAGDDAEIATGKIATMGTTSEVAEGGVSGLAGGLWGLMAAAGILEAQVVIGGIQAHHDPIQSGQISHYKGGKGFAMGGVNIPAGRYLVGEEGTELMDVPGGSTIYNHQQTQQMLQHAFNNGASMGPAPVVHVHNHNDNRIYVDGYEMADHIGQHMLKRIYASGPVKSGA